MSQKRSCEVCETRCVGGGCRRKWSQSQEVLTVFPHLIVIWFVVTKRLHLTAATAADEDSFVALTAAGLHDAAAALHLSAKFRVMRVEALISTWERGGWHH